MDIYKNIADGKYKNNVPILGEYYKSKELRDLEKIPAGSLTDIQFEQLKALREVYKANQAEYHRTLDLYRKEEGRLNDIFKQDCEEAEGFTNHPKKDKLWSKAWEHGHASGYGDIYSWYRELAELLRD
jgi:hypothetical protein